MMTILLIIFDYPNFLVKKNTMFKKKRNNYLLHNLCKIHITRKSLVVACIPVPGLGMVLLVNRNLFAILFTDTIGILQGRQLSIGYFPSIKVAPVAAQIIQITTATFSMFQPGIFVVDVVD